MWFLLHLTTHLLLVIGDVLLLALVWCCSLQGKFCRNEIIPSIAASLFCISFVPLIADLSLIVNLYNLFQKSKFNASFVFGTWTVDTALNSVTTTPATCSLVGRRHSRPICSHFKSWEISRKLSSSSSIIAKIWMLNCHLELFIFVTCLSQIWWLCHNLINDNFLIL